MSWRKERKGRCNNYGWGGVYYKGCGSHSFFYSYHIYIIFKEEKKNETMLLLLNKKLFTC